ncbi:MAG: hypothetical protein JSV11_05955 [Nitrospiraceae bacterium]|nr:MAG: hypothetical protein JSV11_05955 [Nitrospiraceae bacterium]
MKRLGVAIVSVSLMIVSGYAYADNFGFGAHIGYGTLQYEEHTDNPAARSNTAVSEQNVILFGVSGEYTLPRNENLFAGITTDWAIGLEDKETWSKNFIPNQTNLLRIYGQFYDLRFGYKNSIDTVSYRVYASGGFDALHFRRDNFVQNGTPLPPALVTEDFYLWRVGGGVSLGIEIVDGWALDGRGAYSYYPAAAVENSNFPNVEIDTTGSCLDLGLGIVHSVTDKVNVYAGGSFTTLELNSATSGNVLFPESETEILVGVLNATFAF